MVDAIVAAGSTKSVGDGKIFIHPIERTIDISTGEDDDHSESRKGRQQRVSGRRPTCAQVERPTSFEVISHRETALSSS
jgi:hypothetical protein